MASDDQEAEVTVSKIFDEGLDLYNNLGKIDEPTNSPAVQANVKKAIDLFENATRLVSIADLFSQNESFEEIPTNNLKYLLLPVLLGSLTLKRSGGNRQHIVECADIYYKDFVKRCNQYGLSNYKFKDPEDEDSHDEANKSELEVIESQINTRATKIQRFREQKELQSKLESLKEIAANEHCDEEIKREYFLTMIKSFIMEAIDDIGSIEMEKDILKHMSQIKDEKPRKGPQPKPLKPVIITRDAVQKAVYGAGYPSLPTMTVEEFYDKRVRDGIFPDPNKPKEGMSLHEASMAGMSLNDKEREAEEMEDKIENDDEEVIENLRRQDEFKDEHRRGWGNRMNRS